MTVLVDTQRKSCNFFPKSCGHVSDPGTQTAFLFSVTRGNSEKKSKVCLYIPAFLHVFLSSTMISFFFFPILGPSLQILTS